MKTKCYFEAQTARTRLERWSELCSDGVPMIIFGENSGQNMLKITESIKDENTIKVSVDGSITNASVGDLIDVCARFRSRARKIMVLDFSGVTYIDEDAATRVAKLSANGVRIVNCSLFIETLLKSIDE